MILGYPISDMVLGLKDQRSRLGLRLGYSNTAWVQTLRVPSSFNVLELQLCQGNMSFNVVPIIQRLGHATCKATHLNIIHDEGDDHDNNNKVIVRVHNYQIF